MNRIRQYMHSVQETLNQLDDTPIADTIDVLHQARVRGRRVFIMGNGGSASTATHFVCDLMKNTRAIGWQPYKVIGLSDNMAVLSALANDEGYESVFAEQLACQVEPLDVVIGISCSGNSMNVVNALDVANRAGATPIGLTGYDGGKVGKLVSIHCHVPSDCIEQVEDIHVILEHLICTELRERAVNTYFAPQSASRVAISA